MDANLPSIVSLWSYFCGNTVYLSIKSVAVTKTAKKAANL